jgi:GAF domain-containing protein
VAGPDDPSGLGAAGRAVAEGRLVYCADLLEDPTIDQIEGLRDMLERDSLRSTLSLPLMAGGEVLGALVLGDVTDHQYTERETTLLAGFGAQAGLALRSARLFAASEQRRQAAESLVELGRAISRSLDPTEVARQIVASVKELLAPSSASLYHWDPNSDGFTTLAAGIATMRRPPSSSPAAWARSAVPSRRAVPSSPPTSSPIRRSG